MIVFSEAQVLLYIPRIFYLLCILLGNNKNFSEIRVTFARMEKVHD